MTGQPSEEIKALQVHIAALESELDKERLRTNFWEGMYEELEKKIKHGQQVNNQLRARIHELEDPDGRYRAGLSWLGKIIQVLNRVGRPMRSAELYDEIDRMEDGLRNLANPVTLFSVVLNKAIKDGRLTRHKVIGTRGGYYALNRWTSEDGALLPEYSDSLI